MICSQNWTDGGSQSQDMLCLDPEGVLQFGDINLKGFAYKFWNLQEQILLEKGHLSPG